MAAVKLSPDSFNRNCSEGYLCKGGDSHSMPLCPENCNLCRYNMIATNPELYKKLFPESKTS